MLFLYGNLGTTEDFSSFVDAIFESLTEDNVKFVQDSYSAICHFSSTEGLQDMTEFFSEIFDDHISAFFLFETPNMFGMRLDNNLTAHLFDLNADSGYHRFNHDHNIDEDFLRWNRKEIQNLGFSDFKDDFIDEEPSPNDIFRIKQTYVEPLRMDNILDKIATKGIESLTVEEKKYLKNLSD
jgi:hypothetical protein